MRIEAISQPGVCEIRVDDQVVQCCSLSEQRRLMHGIGLMNQEQLKNFYERLKARNGSRPELLGQPPSDRRS